MLWTFEAEGISSLSGHHCDSERPALQSIRGHTFVISKPKAVHVGSLKRAERLHYRSSTFILQTAACNSRSLRNAAMVGVVLSLLGMLIKTLRGARRASLRCNVCTFPPRHTSPAPAQRLLSLNRAI